MRLAGIEGEVLKERRDIEAAIRMACSREDIAVLLISGGCAAKTPELINSLRLSSERPLVVVIPGTSSAAVRDNSIVELIREAIGVKI